MLVLFPSGGYFWSLLVKFHFICIYKFHFVNFKFNFLDFVVFFAIQLSYFSSQKCKNRFHFCRFLVIFCIRESLVPFRELFIEKNGIICKFL